MQYGVSIEYLKPQQNKIVNKVTGKTYITTHTIAGEFKIEQKPFNLDAIKQEATKHGFDPQKHKIQVWTIQNGCYHTCVVE